MITCISKIRSFGVFQDYKAGKDLKPFVQYNLFYGGNGSGKSTLAKVFLSLTDKKTHFNFPDGEFTVLIKDCPEITHKNVAQNKNNIKVFSRDFIDRNVNFEQSKANSILILSEEKKEEMESYHALLPNLLEKEGIYQVDHAAYDKSIEDLKKNLTKWASNVKKAFELIETSNSYYLNYDRTKLNSFIKNQKGNISKDAILSLDEVKNLKNAINPNQKPNITNEFKILEATPLKDQLTEIENLLSTSIFSQQIERLTKNTEINQWVKDGLAIHTAQKSENCEFCGQVLPAARIAELNKHFSKEYDELVQKLENQRGSIIQQLELINSPLPNTSDLYEELHSRYESARQKILEARKNCALKFEEVKTKIAEKEQNPFVVFKHQFGDIESLIKTYNETTLEITGLIEKHNLKNQGFEEAVKKAQATLELHFVSEILIAERFNDVEENMKGKKAALDLKAEEIARIKNQVAGLEAVLLNEAVGADEFNKTLKNS